MQLLRYKRIGVSASDAAGVGVTFHVPLTEFCLVQSTGQRSVFSAEYGLMVTNDGTVNGQIALFSVYVQAAATNVCDQLV